MKIPALALLLLASAATNGWADYRESYRKGLEAMEKGDWPETILRMREAAAEQPFEGERIKIYGVRFEVYLPYYHIGLALSRARDCEGALQAWQRSEEQGAIKKWPQYKTLVKEKQSCEGRAAQARAPSPPSLRPAAPDPALVSEAAQHAEGQLERALEAARSVAAAAKEPALTGVWAADPNLGGAEREATELIAAARAKLEAGRRESDLAELVHAGDLAGRAAAKLDAVRNVAMMRREAAQVSAQMAAQRKVVDDLTKSMETSGRDAPPPELMTAAFLFFSGQYESAVDVIAGLKTRGGRASAQGMLLRAAARYALYVVGGEKDSTLLNAAQSDVVACRKFDPHFVPDPQFFSPRFREFFQATR